MKIIFTAIFLISIAFAEETNGGSVTKSNPDKDKVTINVEIADGQAGTLLSETEEDTPGAFTVANKNDTDGDGTVDTADQDVQGEIDLMQLKLNPPTNTDQEADCTLTVPTNAKLFKSNDKKAGEETKRTWKVKELPKTFWVELQDSSSAVRSEVFTWTGNGVSDTCKATGIWVTKDGFRNVGNVLSQDANEQKLVNTFAIYSNPGPALGLSSNPFANGMEMQFKVKPAKMHMETKVTLDISRQIEEAHWTIIGQNVTPGTTSNYPAVEGEPSDDDNDGDEDNVPDLNDHCYSVDSIAIGALDPTEDRYVAKFNFREFARIKIKLGASFLNTNGMVEGSRSSDYIPWQASFDLVKGNQGSSIRNATGNYIKEGQQQLTQPTP